MSVCISRKVLTSPKKKGFISLSLSNRFYWKSFIYFDDVVDIKKSIYKVKMNFIVVIVSVGCLDLPLEQRKNGPNFSL